MYDRKYPLGKNEPFKYLQAIDIMLICTNFSNEWNHLKNLKHDITYWNNATDKEAKNIKNIIKRKLGCSINEMIDEFNNRRINNATK